jgi:plasmid stabilization system protein ParE
MNIVFLDQANREFSDAVQYYDSQEPGLGQRFEEEIERAIHWLSINPEACALRRGIYRRMNLRVFPYYIPYVIREQTLWVVAIAQSQRRPEYWIRRAKTLD